MKRRAVEDARGDRPTPRGVAGSAGDEDTDDRRRKSRDSRPQQQPPPPPQPEPRIEPRPAPAEESAVGRQRNKRMFGLLQSTLQDFKADSTEVKKKRNE